MVATGICEDTCYRKLQNRHNQLGHVAEWLRSGLQIHLVLFQNQSIFRKIKRIAPTRYQ